MQNTFTRADLKELIEYGSAPCVSIYLPTHRTGTQREQDRIRLKNLIREAVDKLVANGLRRPDAQEFVQEAEHWRTTENYWQIVSNGLAIFLGPDWSRQFQLPLEFEPIVVVNDRFYVKPLLPLLQDTGRFFVLALSQDRARLYEATRYSISEIDLPEIERTEIDGVDETLQYHSHRAPTAGQGETGERIFHGQGGADDRTKRDLQKQFHSVNRSVRQALRGQNAPLVLACVGYLAPIYASANTYPHLINAKVPGNPDTWSVDDLRERAWQLVQPHFRERQEKAIAAWRNAQGKGRASDEIREVVLAADQGRVQTLLVARDRQQWGNVEPQLQAVHLCNDGDPVQGNELLDFAAAETLAHGGDVFALPTESLPTQHSPIAAIFRYSAGASQ